ncbi:MAG: hypothetical protein ACI84D_001995 [Thalassolituus oleivorans]
MGGSWAVMSAPAALSIFDLACTNRQTGTFAVLSGWQAAELDALTALIVPSDATGPGAREAGVVWFIDAAVSQDPDGPAQQDQMLSELTTAVRERFGSDSLAELAPEEQIQIAHDLEETQFFGQIRNATLNGMFAHPRHGGNRDKAGWKLIGFDDRHAWQPPFGHYDAEYANPSSDA